MEFLDEVYPFTLVEMYNDNIGHTSFEVTWVEETPDSFVSELEDAIVDFTEQSDVGYICHEQPALHSFHQI